MAPSLIPCVACGCHVRSTDPACPSCGEPLRRGDGAVQRPVVAVLLGLTAAGALAASCSGNSVGNAPMPIYGIALSPTSTGTASSGDAGSD